MAAARSASSRPRSELTSAAACLISAWARMNRRGNRCPEIGKLMTARCVEAPYSASAGTSMSPIESRSTRVAAPPLLAWLLIAPDGTAGRRPSRGGARAAGAPEPRGRPSRGPNGCRLCSPGERRRGGDAMSGPAEAPLVRRELPAPGPSGEPLDGVALLTLDRPQVMNALSFALLAELGDALAGLDA